MVMITDDTKNHHLAERSSRALDGTCETKT